uniref:Uncharacterized protein n=1 Tax=Anopheles atroparvus TaxID=41427 RepID=A0AAG5DWB9_ANOAO
TRQAVQLLLTVIASSVDGDVHISIEAVPDIDAFRRANPEHIVAPLQSHLAKGATGRQQIVYTLGSRAAGDRLVGLASDNMAWATPQNVKLELQYPTAGVGAYLSYVEVVVSQSSANGRGYVVSGGVGQRAVHLVIEAYDTVYFNYAAGIYGF